MKLEAASPSTAEFTPMFSEVLTGCSNLEVTLSVEPDGKVTGTRNRFELSLVKN